MALIDALMVLLVDCTEMSTVCIVRSAQDKRGVKSVQTTVESVDGSIRSTQIEMAWYDLLSR